jgi:hypothetical protein
LGLSSVAESAAAFAVLAFLFLFLASFFVLCFVMVRVLLTTRYWETKPEEEHLGWSERMGRRSSRFDRFFVAPEFRSERRWLFVSIAGALCSLGALMLITVIFGERA